MAQFNFPYHTVETENPDSSVNVQFGNSYVFTTPPNAPDQRIFTLHFKAMKYFLNGAGQLDENVYPDINMFRLTKFYQEHKTWKAFEYIHPVHGPLSVRFHRPLAEPEGVQGGNGVVKEFEVTLIEIP